MHSTRLGADLPGAAAGTPAQARLQL